MVIAHSFSSRVGELESLGWSSTTKDARMSDEKNQIHDNPKAALAAYIEDLEENYYTWYERAANRNYTMWTVAQGTAVIAGVATAVLAAFMREELFKGYSFFRIALIVLPVIGTLASTFLLQTRVRDLLALRERGRQSVQALITRARAEFAAAASAERLTTIHRDLAVEIARIEKEQTVGFFAVVPEMTTQTQKDASTLQP